MSLAENITNFYLNMNRMLKMYDKRRDNKIKNIKFKYEKNMIMFFINKNDSIDLWLQVHGPRFCAWRFFSIMNMLCHNIEQKRKYLIIYWLSLVYWI